MKKAHSFIAVIFELLATLIDQKNPYILFNISIFVRGFSSYGDDIIKGVNSRVDDSSFSMSDGNFENVCAIVATSP